MFYEPKNGYPFDENPFAALVFPRPIGWISTLSKNGIANLAPYSFFNAIAYEPPQVMFSATDFHSDGGLKDSIANVLSTKEFVVNLATKKLKIQVSQSSIEAALNPEQGDSLFFVSKGDGTHHFSDTLEEHNKAVKKFQLNK